MSRQLSRGSAGEYQADEQVGVARLRWRVSDRKSTRLNSSHTTVSRIRLLLHQMIEIILLRCTLEQKGIARLEEWAWAGFGVGQILLLQIRKAFRLQNCNSAFVLHMAFSFPYASSMALAGQLSRGSAGEYQADEQGGVARLRCRVSGR